MCAEIYEEVIDGYEIYIESNPDQWRGGVIWSVCKGDAELDCGLEFCVADALVASHQLIENLTNQRC